MSVDNNSVDNFLNNLRNFDNLLNHSWNNNDFFYNFFNLHNFGYFNHLFNDLIDIDSNLFYSFNHFWNLDNLLNHYLYWLLNNDFYNSNGLNLNDLRNFDNSVFIDNNFDDLSVLNFLNSNLSDNFWDFLYSLNDHWNVVSSFNNFLNLSNSLEWSFNNSFNFFYSFFVNYLFLNNFDFLDDWDLNSNFNNLLNHLRNFNNSFVDLIDNNWSLVDNFDNVCYFLNVIDNFPCSLNFNFFNNDFLLFGEDVIFVDFHNLFYNLLNDCWHFKNLFDDFFNNDYFFLDHFNFSVLNDRHVDNFLNNSWNLNMYDFLNNNFDSDYFWNFDDSFYDLFNDSWNFNWLLDFSFNNNNFVMIDIDVFIDLDWDVNDFLDFNNLSLLNDSFDNLLDWHDLRNFNDSVNNFLDNFFDLNNLRDNSEDFKNIVNVDNIHNFCIDHTDNSLIDIEDHLVTISSLELFNFLKESFEKNSKMKFNSSGFLAAEGVDVFDSVDVRDVFHNFNNSVKLVNFNDVNKFLVEELGQSCVTLFSKFGIFGDEFLHLNCQHVDQVLGSGIRNWNFNNSVLEINNVSDSINERNINAFSSDQSVQLALEVKNNS